MLGFGNGFAMALLISNVMKYSLMFLKLVVKRVHFDFLKGVLIQLSSFCLDL